MHVCRTLSYLSFQPLCFILCLIYVGSVMIFIVLMTELVTIGAYNLVQEKEKYIYEKFENS